mmetsp:Transcript_107503/g.334140  ORF Transcript_107503/g.334140 Transcript_107503/m.334140 type:complete len:326 (-) Transcript_107503:89-1066(-)
MQPAAPLLLAGLVRLGLLPCAAAVLPLLKSQHARPASHAIPAAVRLHGRRAKDEEKKENCGPLSEYPHARPKNAEDARKTKYDKEAKATVEVTFSAGDKVDFECVPGYTTDGAKDGKKAFEVECSEKGYYKPSAVCLKASKCGAIPSIPHAIPSGKNKGGKVGFSCSNGYSLDGKKVVPGGMAKNRDFELACVKFSGKYQKFKGECKPYAFVPSTEVARVYDKVVSGLFVVSCKGTLKEAFGRSGAVPATLKEACEKVGDKQKGPCNGLVDKIKGEFKDKQKAREEHEEEAKKEWFEAPDEDRPGVTDEATKFCEDLWKLLKLPE